MILCRRAHNVEFRGLSLLRIDMLREEFEMPPETDAEIIYNTEQFFRDGTRDGTVIPLAAIQGAEIIGMCAVSFFTLPPTDWNLKGKTAHLGNMYVKPEYRRQGVASSLLSIALSEIKAFGCERILLGSSEAARPLYEKFGFEAIPGAMELFPERQCGV